MSGLLHRVAHWLRLNLGSVVVLDGPPDFATVGFQCATCGEISGRHLREIKVNLS